MRAVIPQSDRVEDGVGLMPMVLALTVDIVGQDAYVGAPSTQYWVQLSTAVVGGLFAATALTVLVTPSMLAWWDRRFAPEGASRETPLTPYRTPGSSVPPA